MNTSQPERCVNCAKGGLPILPVRYTVLPKSVAAKLANGITGRRVTDVALTQHHYGLRILREGWLYLFYVKGPRGANYWEAYKVTGDGRVWWQSLPAPAVPVTHPSCAKSGHAVPMDIIAISQPELCGEVYIAFSGETWTDDIFKRYAQNAELRNKRMQCIEPAKWIAGGKYEHAAAATEASIDEVVEYMPGFDSARLQPGRRKLGDGAGKHKPEVLKLEATRYPLHIRQATPDSASKALVGVMNDVGKRKGGRSYPPMLLALWDAVGNVHELNGFRSDPLSWFNQYVESEHALRVSALHDIDTARKVVQSIEGARLDAAEDRARQAQGTSALGASGARAALAAQRQKALAGADPSRVTQINAWYDDMDWMAANDIPASHQRRVIQMGQLSSAGDSRSRVPYTGSHRDSVMKAARDYANARPGARDRNHKQMVDYKWSTYEARLRSADIRTFRKHYEDLQSAVHELQESRSDDVGQWVKAQLLLDTLEDCHSADFCASLTFEIIVSEALFGLTSTPKGKVIVDNLIAEWDPTQQGSLIWRVMAMNQMDARKELGQLLKSAQAKKDTPLDTLGAAVVGVVTPAKSVIKYYKDLSRLALETDSRKISPLGELFKRLQIDKFGLTVGDAIFEKFRVAKIGDFVGEKVIQTLFLQRAGVPYEDAIALVRKQAEFETLGRVEIINRVRVARKILRGAPPEKAPVPTRELYAAWDRIKVTEEEGAKQLRLGRIAVVTLLLETANFWHLMAGAPDKDTRLNLAKSGASLGASVITVAMYPYQAVLKNSVRSQVWKLTGGALGSVGPLISAWMDGKKPEARRRQQYDVVVVLQIKFGVGVLSGTAMLIDATSAAAPLLKKLAARYGTDAVMAAVEVFTERIAVVAGLRAFGMLIGWEATIGLLLFQMLADWLTPDALEAWCSRCAFGTGRERILSIKDHDVEKYNLTEVVMQRREFVEAMVKMG
ncbi:hypothetical protein LIG30_0911 [Burkholderia sp. lig30]|jgi:hypothetical protein|uniref:T6SS effector BTH_I2691 family protein n=1 Tax=Burkholderia sp. lig30 TaxID=1192124 RepID=UPI000460F075|nr:T6SS effector BTH_I2691 family protein [Burkholderia sp. lig30]KDB10170.1 hypothetical protein LIG30_0911 [Burkholderia sp. lig30]